MKYTQCEKCSDRGKNWVQCDHRGGACTSDLRDKDLGRNPSRGDNMLSLGGGLGIHQVEKAELQR